MAAVLRPVIVNYTREFKIEHGVQAAQAYNTIMYVLTVLLLIGLLCILALKPLAEKRREGHSSVPMGVQRRPDFPVIGVSYANVTDGVLGFWGL